MNRIFSSQEHPADVMVRVAALLTLVAELLAAGPPGRDVQLSETGAHGLAVLTLLCAEALHDATANL